MTNIIALAEELYKSVNQQKVPEEIGQAELADMIVSAIKDLYVISGRTMLWEDEWITYDEDECPVTFEEDLKLDEQRWV